MESNWIIIFASAGLGVTHTLLAPNHYLPFIMIGRARGWTLPKTVFITFLCSTGHILGSLAVAALAVIFGIAVSKIEIADGYRANIAAWGLMLFGAGYFIYGVKAASHNHSCCEHIHTPKDDIKSLTPFILFMIFLFAPCEAFVPMIMFPALANIPLLTFLTALAFGLSTMVVMTTAVYFGYKGMGFLPFKKWEKYGHMIAGLVILLCGILAEALGHLH